MESERKTVDGAGCLGQRRHNWAKRRYNRLKRRETTE